MIRHNRRHLFLSANLSSYCLSVSEWEMNYVECACVYVAAQGYGQAQLPGEI